MRLSVLARGRSSFFPEFKDEELTVGIKKNCFDKLWPSEALRSCMVLEIRQKR